MCMLNIFLVRILYCPFYTMKKSVTVYHGQSLGEIWLQATDGKKIGRRSFLRSESRGRSGDHFTKILPHTSSDSTDFALNHQQHELTGSVLLWYYFAKL